MWSKEGVVIITGANRGIGFQIARRFGMDNYPGTVIVCSRYSDRGIQAINKLSFEFPKVNFISYKLDVTNAKNRILFLKEIQQDYGKVDVLFNNAGVTHLRIDEVLATNYWAVKDLTYEILPMLRKDTGRVINLGSMDSDDSYRECSARIQHFLKTNTMRQDELDDMVEEFQSNFMKGTHEELGYSSYQEGYWQGVRK